MDAVKYLKEKARIAEGCTNRIDAMNNRRNSVKCIGRNCADCYRDYWFAKVE